MCKPFLKHSTSVFLWFCSSVTVCLVCEALGLGDALRKAFVCFLGVALYLSSVPGSMCLVHLLMCEFWLGRSKAGASCCSGKIFGGKRESPHPQSARDELIHVEMDGPESEYMTIDPIVPRLLCHVSGWPLQHS